MLTKNVFYSERPSRVMITANAGKAVVCFPVNVVEVEAEDRVQYLAEKVYSMTTMATPNLQERVEQNYEAWFELASKTEPQKATLDDAIEAINVLTDLIIGGYYG